MKKVDLNSDIGESMGIYRLGLDEEIVKYISSANIACGWHAGDPVVMEKTIEVSKAHGVKIGAHPGFMDMIGFGRRSISVTPEELKAYVKYQLGAMMGMAKSRGVRVSHLKAHGAMYNMAAKDERLARALAEAVYEVDGDIILVGLSKSEIIKAGKTAGIKVANEVFADRSYNDDGTLVPRNAWGATIEDESLAIERVLDMVKKGVVKSINGREIEISADTICVHGDNPNAVKFAKSIKERLEQSKVLIVPMDELI
jgi:5-oxoprolinase (ATP-hydrolysing) subunit A